MLIIRAPNSTPGQQQFMKQEIQQIFQKELRNLNTETTERR